MGQHWCFFEFSKTEHCNHKIPPWGLLPYCGEDVCAPQWSGQLCWWEHKLLVATPCQTGQRVRAKRSAVPGPLGWGLSVGLTISRRKLTFTKPLRSQKPTRDCSANKREVVDHSIRKRMILANIQIRIFAHRCANKETWQQLQA